MHASTIHLISKIWTNEFGICISIQFYSIFHIEFYHVQQFSNWYNVVHHLLQYTI